MAMRAGKQWESVRLPRGVTGLESNLDFLARGRKGDLRVRDVHALLNEGWMWESAMDYFIELVENAMWATPLRAGDDPEPMLEDSTVPARLRVLVMPSFFASCLSHGALHTQKAARWKQLQTDLFTVNKRTPMTPAHPSMADTDV